MKRFPISILSLFVSSSALAYDCSNVSPFPSSGTLRAFVFVSRYVWKNGSSSYEEVCSEERALQWYDVRGREEEAFYCLAPNPSEIVTCETKLNEDAAKIHVVPASWIRLTTHDPLREYRFHAYVEKDADPEYFYDIYSRTLSPDLSPRDVIVEGSLKTGPKNPHDGFYIRVDFAK